MVPSSSLCCDRCGAVNAPGADLCIICHHPLLISQASVSAYLASNTLFKGCYRIISKIGAGGFGSVYKATDTQSAGRLVAIKEVCLQGLRPQTIKEATDAFQREVNFLSQLAHPGLPRLYEHSNGPEHYYLVMDFLEGETLEEHQNKAQDRHLLLSEVLDIGLQLCAVLEYLHTHHPPIVFRDLKPTNIIRAPWGKLYLIDFGIARFFKPGQGKDTIALGSLGYAAPEQYGRAQTTPRADIYSLGAVLHQLLTGNDPSEAPFQFAPLRGKSSQGLSDPGTLSSSMVDIMMSSLGKLITSMVEMDVNKRPASISFVMQELHRLATIWSDVNRSFWRPSIPRTYLSQTRTTSQSTPPHSRQSPQSAQQSPGHP